MESQTRPYGHDQAEDPIRIHHPEEEEHQEKGATKVLKKVKEKAKKIKNSLTKHGHEHDHDVEEEDDEQNPEVHGAPVYESSAVRDGVTGQPESLSHPGETNAPAAGEIIPPGTKVFPVVSSDHTKTVEPETLQDASYRHEAPSHPVSVSDLSDRGESREAHQMPMNTPGEDEYLGGQRKVNIERPKKLEEDPAAVGGGSDSLSGASNYQSKQGGGEAEIAESLGRMKVTDESPDERSGRGFERDLPTRSHESGPKNQSRCGEGFPADFGGESGAGIGKDFPTRSHGFDQENDSGIGKDSAKESHGYGEESGPGLEKNFPARSDDVKVETGLGRDLPTGTHDQFSPELSRPKERDDFDSKAEETRDEKQGSKPSTYTEKMGSAASFVTDKAIAAKNAVASKLGYSGETTGGGGKQGSPLGDETMRSSGQQQSPVGEETPRSATGYGQKVAGTVAEKLTPVYEKVKETGSTVMTKLPLLGGGSRAEETQQVEDKGVPARGYLAEKLRPGEDDKALSEVIAEKLHLGGGGEKKKKTTKEVEVTVEKIPSDQISEEREHGDVIAEEGKGGGGTVGKLKGAVTSWLGGSTEEVKPKSSDSGEKSSQSLGSTVGTMGFSDSGEVVPTQRGLQESGN